MNYGRIIFILWMIFILYWIAFLRGNKRAVRRINPGARIPPLICLFALFWLFQIHPGFFHRPLYARNHSVEAVGVVLCALGIGFAIWARNILGRNWSGIPQIKEGHELIRAGPYRLVRHPIYTGILLAIFGTGFGRGQMRDLVIFLFGFIALWIKLKVEESLLTQQFPEAYPQYRDGTKALIPYLL
jgi:protein-S-isoprenylcysteine O-methyltransferase Ste14